MKRKKHREVERCDVERDEGDVRHAKDKWFWREDDGVVSKGIRLRLNLYIAIIVDSRDDAKEDDKDRR